MVCSKFEAHIPAYTHHSYTCHKAGLLSIECRFWVGIKSRFQAGMRGIFLAGMQGRVRVGM